MTPHAHGGASAWDPNYATTPRLVFFIIFFSFKYKNVIVVLIMMTMMAHHLQH
jgi:hypothetical protein